MSAQLIIILAAIFFGFSLLYFLLKNKLDQVLNKPTDPVLSQWLQSVNGNLTSNNQHLTTTLQKSYHELNQRLEHATSVISDLKKEAGSFSEIGRSMRDLQDYLKSPKLRGNLGEQVLKDLISQIFPKSSFVLQHRFNSGSIVDAAIKTDAGILPIDSKFPMENFQRLLKSTEEERSLHTKAFIRDVEKHVKDIANKYILPSEGTMDFALMYLPSESVYYEVVNQPQLVEFARNHRVYPVSPTTLYAHLQTILLSFEGKKIESQSKEVFTILRSIKHDHHRLEKNLNLLSRHLTNAYNQINNTTQSANLIGQKLTSVSSLGSGID